MCICGICARKPFFCSFLTVPLSIFFGWLGVWSILLFRRFTPLYKDITCRYGSASILNFTMGVLNQSPTTFKLQLAFSCQNPNPYEMAFAYSEKGGVYLGQGKTQVGDGMAAQDVASAMPAGGTGVITINSDVKVTRYIVAQILPEMMMSSGVPLFIEVNQRVLIDVGFFFGHWRVSRAFRKDCGLYVAGLASFLTQGRPKLGPMACAASFEQLQVPPIGLAAADGSVKFSAFNMAPEEIEKGTLAKDWGLGVTIMVSLLLSLIMSVCSVHLLLRAFGLCQPPKYLDDEAASILSEE